MNATRRAILCGLGPATIAGLRGATARAAGPPTDEPPEAVVDAHTHFYDPTRPEGVPWPRPDDQLLHRPMLPPDWERVAGPEGVTGTIVIEASRRPDDNGWLLALARRHACILGVVGSLPLGDPACAGLLARFTADPLFRGLRTTAGDLRAGLRDRAFRADLVRLADRDLALDVLGPDSLGAAAEAAAAVPALRIVVDHLGTPPPDGPADAWRRALDDAARQPTVHLKASSLHEAITAAGGRTDPTRLEPLLAAAWDACGERRVLFGSNWPVSLRAGTYAAGLHLLRPLVAARGGTTARWFFHGAARAAYRWPPRDQPAP